jgi:predicted deacylase
MPPPRVTSIDFEGLADSSRHSFDLEVAPMADGNYLTVPIMVIAGSGRRPVFTAIAGIHGDEPEGMLALLDLWHELDPLDLKGRFVIVPIANPPAFAAGRRTSPLDNLDLNRIFPGRPDGTPSQRMARELFDAVVGPADLLFTLHCWYSYGVAEDFIECGPAGSKVAAESLQAAVASGFKRIRITDWPAGLLARVAIAAGIPAIEAEIGALGMSLPENRLRYCDHVRRLLRHLGMLGGTSDRPDPDLWSARHVLALAGGLLRRRVGLGDPVKAGDILATIHDLHDRLLAEVAAPDDGIVGAHRTFASVNPGDNLFTVFRRLGRAAEATAWSEAS